MERVFQNTATPHSFTCQTDYSAAKAFSVSKPQSVRACLGGVSGSFLDLWGGEFEWDNFKVIHHQGRGQKTGVVIEYGKNLTDLEHDNENTDVYTDLLPYAVITAEDGTETVITLEEVLIPIAETTLVQRKTLIRDFTEYFDEQNPVSESGLRAFAYKYLSNNLRRSMEGEILFWWSFVSEHKVTQDMDGITVGDLCIPIVNQHLIHLLHRGKWTVAMSDNIRMTQVQVACIKNHRVSPHT